MIPTSFNYSAPATLAEALGLLADGSAKVLAGGMSLVPMMKLRLATPEHLVDLGRIADLAYIREDGDVIRIGGMTTHYAIESSALLASQCPLLTKAAGQIGDVQVRNRGTLGGSIAHNDPAADWPASLLALGATVKLQSSTGTRELSIEDFLVDTFTTALEPGELVTEITVPKDQDVSSSTYLKYYQPASGFAIVGVAAHVVSAGGQVVRARVGVTGLGNKAYRARAVETAIEAGQSAGEAAALVTDGIDANSDIHASAEYRKHLAVVYTRRALASVLP
ncbi:MAG: xanthine dehydrogenase family protein subunit M [Acidobacteria bacterium]|nr:xanthine dehydrogenase family protein subunit M [Acidobacteriota bacterium]